MGANMMRIKTKNPRVSGGFCISMAATYSPSVLVPSAQTGLTTLFGMGRGDPRCNNHHVFTKFLSLTHWKQHKTYPGSNPRVISTTWL